MELTQLPSFVEFLAITASISLLIASILFISNKNLTSFKKSKSSKLLLKELLEELRLEVPAELEEVSQEAIKTIKGS